MGVSSLYLGSTRSLTSSVGSMPWQRDTRDTDVAMSFFLGGGASYQHILFPTSPWMRLAGERAIRTTDARSPDFFLWSVLRLAKAKTKMKSPQDQVACM